MKKYCYLLLVVFTSLLSVGCDDSKDTSGVFVDYEKARDDLRREQAHFIPNTDFQLTFHWLWPAAFISERNGIREATVKHNSETMGVQWYVNCKKKQFIWSQTWPKKFVSIAKQPKRGTQGYVVIVNICSLPTQRFGATVPSELKWK